MGHSLGAHAQDLPRLSARGNPEHGWAVHGGNLDLRPQNCLGDVDIQVENNILLAPAEEPVGFNENGYVQVSVWTAVQAWLSFARQPNLGAVVNPAGNRDHFLARAPLQAAPLAGMARGGDGLAHAVAYRASPNLNH